MGLTPPFFLLSAIRVASKKRGRICVGVSPDSTKLVKYVSAVSSFLPSNPAEVLIRSLRCCGRRPSGPPAEPLGKDFYQSSTSGTPNSAQVAMVVAQDRLHSDVRGASMGRMSFM